MFFNKVFEKKKISKFVNQKTQAERFGDYLLQNFRIIIFGFKFTNNMIVYNSYYKNIGTSNICKIHTQGKL